MVAYKLQVVRYLNTNNILVNCSRMYSICTLNYLLILTFDNCCYYK